MFQLIVTVLSLLLFALSLSLFSKSAEQRARSRTELYYASQIREETETIRLHNEKLKKELTNYEEDRYVADFETPVHLSVGGSQIVLEQEATKTPIQKVELKELELDQKALEFVSKLQPKHEQMALQEVTVYEKPASWFNFPEVDLFMNQRPEKGLYYISGKVLDVLDDMSAIISDGTGERMLYHHKVQYLSVGDIIISQVEIDKSVWNFITVWEISETDQTRARKAM